MFLAFEREPTIYRIRKLVGRLDQIEFIIPRLFPRVIPSISHPRKTAYMLISLELDVLKHGRFKQQKNTITNGNFELYPE